MARLILLSFAFIQTRHDLLSHQDGKSGLGNLWNRALPSLWSDYLLGGLPTFISTIIGSRRLETAESPCYPKTGHPCGHRQDRIDRRRKGQQFQLLGQQRLLLLEPHTLLRFAVAGVPAHSIPGRTFHIGLRRRKHPAFTPSVALPINRECRRFPRKVWAESGRRYR